MMTLKSLIVMAKVAREHPHTVLDMLKAGLLEPSLRPMIAKGSGKYLKAIEAGDIASPYHESVREMICGQCNAQTFATSPGGVSGWVFEWCGVPLYELVSGEKAKMHAGVMTRPEWRGVDWDKVEGPACGCLLALKRKVASEKCPKGEWGAVPPAMPVTLTVGASG